MCKNLRLTSKQLKRKIVSLVKLRAFNIIPGVSASLDQATFLATGLSRMREGRKEKVMTNTPTKVIGILLVVFCGGLVCPAQDKLRRVEQPAKFVYSNTPIRVVVKMGGQEMPNREGQAGPDWLRRMTLEVTNMSGKDINLLWINLMLKEPKYGAKEATTETAGIVITVELRHSPVKVLRAGDSVTLKPPITMVDYWTKYAREQGMDDIERVILDIRQVGFTDDTAWTRGRLSRKDPESGRFILITEKPESPAFYSPTSILTPNRQRFFFDAGLNLNQPETDPGGCVWLSFETIERIGCATVASDGCSMYTTCDRPRDAEFYSTTPPAG